MPIERIGPYGIPMYGVATAAICRLTNSIRPNQRAATSCATTILLERSVFGKPPAVKTPQLVARLNHSWKCDRRAHKCADVCIKTVSTSISILLHGHNGIHACAFSSSRTITPPQGKLHHHRCIYLSYIEGITAIRNYAFRSRPFYSLGKDDR